MAEIKVTNLVKFYMVFLLNKSPKHGYELIKELKKCFGKEISAAHVYPFLKLLEKNRLIGHKKVEAREKKKYFITQKGRVFSKDLLSRFNDILDSMVAAKIKKCYHCNCEIYKNGFEKKVNGKKLTFCCKHCANH